MISEFKSQYPDLFKVIPARFLEYSDEMARMEYRAIGIEDTATIDKISALVGKMRRARMN